MPYRPEKRSPRTLYYTCSDLWRGWKGVSLLCLYLFVGCLDPYRRPINPEAFKLDQTIDIMQDEEVPDESYPNPTAESRKRAKQA